MNFCGPAVANGVVFFGGSGFAVNENRGDGIGVGAPGPLTAYEARGLAVSHGRVFIGSGFRFFAVADQPLAGALEVVEVP